MYGFRFSLMLYLTLVPLLARAQAINPSTITQSDDIILQYTDVYYAPYGPPGPNDVREYLSNRGDIYRDPDGLGSKLGGYFPQIYDEASGMFVALRDWAPHGTPIGEHRPWQRYFYARNKSDGSHSDIVAGGHTLDSVIVSKNEDVDFRATGTVKLENGFHVKPGAFFHAYQEPRWDTMVFADDFDDTATFHDQWLVIQGHSTNSGHRTHQCLYDSNIALIADPDALDGHALDVMFRIPGDTCDCYKMDETDSCEDKLHLEGGVPVTHRSLTSSGYVRSCPFPRKSTASWDDWAYPHMPFGKFEIREKVPSLPHHTNFWGGSGRLEWDAGETNNNTIGVRDPNWGHAMAFGPHRGYFKIRATDTLFISVDPTDEIADSRPTGRINSLAINGIAYETNNDDDHFVKDTARARPGKQFSSSLVTSNDTFTYYYYRDKWLMSDTVVWHILHPTSSAWVFIAPYHIRSGDSILFERDYQPLRIRIKDSVDITGKFHVRTHTCHWSGSLNIPNHGYLVIEDTDVHPIGLTVNVVADTFAYELPDQYADKNYSGFGTRQPSYIAGAGLSNMPTGADSIALVTQEYRYHTITMEFLPHEVRYLYDSVVVWRFPDRLLPPSSPYYHWIEQYGRTGLDILAGEFDADDPVAHPSGNGTYTYDYFLSHLTNPGFSAGAAHHKVDYVRVYDVPSSMIVPNMPH